MQRRTFLKLGLLTGGATLAACSSVYFYPDNHWLNPCLSNTIPAHLLDNPIYTSAMQNIKGVEVWDNHVHLLGVGDEKMHWVNSNMQSWLHPILAIQYYFYINGSCVDKKAMNESFILRLLAQQKAMPKHSKLMLMAFDHVYDKAGRKQMKHSAYYIANEYAHQVANQHPTSFEWIASVHPYRQDMEATLLWAIKQGAKAVKWLPPAMGIDPASALCDKFYDIMAKHRIPLLSHAGEEKAVHGVGLADLGNPLRLRRALDRGVRVIVAHCGALGESEDLDKGGKSKKVKSFDLFARLMNDKHYDNLLLSDISAMALVNRVGEDLRSILKHPQWHARLLKGSDYPLPGVMPLFSVKYLARKGFLDPAKIEYLLSIRNYNSLLFDFLLTRHLNVEGYSFLPEVFHTRSHFEKV